MTPEVQTLPVQGEAAAADDRGASPQEPLRGAEPVVCARDASYRCGSYRSFEFATFDVYAGEVCALVSSAHAPVRDLLLAIAGLVAPTAGSLRVDGAEYARRTRSGLLGGMLRRVAPARVGLGVVSGVAEVDGSLTVEEAVACERALRLGRGARRGTGRSRASDAVLEGLAAFGLATHADQRVERLSAAACGRLSAALACAGAPRVAVVDLADPSCSGMAVGELEVMLRDLGDVARAHDMAIIVGMTEPAAARAATRALALDMDAAEALTACGIASNHRGGRPSTTAGGAFKEVDGR